MKAKTKTAIHQAILYEFRIFSVAKTFIVYYHADIV